jgi:hypothetical protein
MAEVITIHAAVISSTFNASACVLSGSLSVSLALGQRNTANLTIVSEDGSYTPDEGDAVLIQTGSPAIDLFGGTVDEVQTTLQPGGTQLTHVCLCVGYEQMCDRRYVGQRHYDAQAAGAIISDINHNCLYGEGSTSPSDSLDDSGVLSGPTIGPLDFDYQTVAEAFDQIVALCNGYAWDIDARKLLRFYQKTTYNAPFTITDAAPNCLAVNVTKTVTRKDYCNAVVVRVGQYITDPITESFVGDNSTRVFTLANPVASEPTITMNGPQTVGIRGIDEATKQWLYAVGSPDITQSELYSSPPPAPLTLSETLWVVAPQYDSKVVAVQNDGEIAARAAKEGNSGRYEKLIEADTPMNGTDATAFATAYLARYAAIPTAFDGVTETAGLLPGQTLTVALAKLGILSSPVTTFLVERVTIADMGGYLHHSFSAVNGALLGNWETQLAGLGGGGGVAGITGASAPSTMAVTIHGAPMTY